MMTNEEWAIFGRLNRLDGDLPRPALFAAIRMASSWAVAG
jgi:hypothetical protein